MRDFSFAINGEVAAEMGESHVESENGKKLYVTPFRSLLMVKKKKSKRSVTQSLLLLGLSNKLFPGKIQRNLFSFPLFFCLVLYLLKVRSFTLFQL